MGANRYFSSHCVARAAKRGDDKKKHIILDAMISDVLCDLPFTQDQPLKSADDYYMRILRNTTNT